MAAFDSEFAGKGPRFSKKATPADRARGWLTWARDREGEPYSGVNALLDTLDAVVPPAAGGPAAKGSASARAAAWQEWWDKNKARYSPEACERLVAAYMDASDADRPARLAELQQTGAVATPYLVDLIHSSSGERKSRAAFGLSLIAHKPWDLTTKPSDRDAFGADWKRERDKLDEDHAKKLLDDDLFAQRVATLGERDAYVASHIEAQHAQQEGEIVRWWFRAEERFVQFSALRQFGRAFTQTQFGNWFRGIANGFDFGQSYAFKGKTVLELIAREAPRHHVAQLRLDLPHLHHRDPARSLLGDAPEMPR